MPIKRPFSTRWEPPYPLPGAGAKCRQTLPCSFCPLRSMILESYVEWLAQNGGEDPSGGEVVPAPAPRGRETPGGVWHDGARQGGPGGVWLAGQYSLCGAPQPRSPPARGGGGPSGQYVVSG